MLPAGLCSYAAAFGTRRHRGLPDPHESIGKTSSSGSAGPLGGVPKVGPRGESSSSSSPSAMDSCTPGAVTPGIAYKNTDIYVVNICRQHGDQRLGQ